MSELLCVNGPLHLYETNSGITALNQCLDMVSCFLSKRI